MEVIADILGPNYFSVNHVIGCIMGTGLIIHFWQCIHNGTWLGAWGLRTFLPASSCEMGSETGDPFLPAYDEGALRLEFGMQEEVNLTCLLGGG